MVVNRKPYLASRRVFLLTSAVTAAVMPLLSFGPAAAQDALAGRDLTKDKRPVIHADGPKFGSYDPYGDFSQDKTVVTEHLFLPWQDVELKGLGAADEYASARGRKVLITIEPWSWAKDWNISTAELRNGILSGKYDANMRAVLNAVSGFKSPIVIRWAQEMDNPSGRFTWANWKPADYIKAFRRMHGIIREILPQAQVMWSPKGEKNLPKYYPGSEYVDIVGLSVFGYDEYDKIAYGKPRSFAEALKQGYDLTVGYGKPIWVAELGYEGNLDYVTKWAQDVTQNFPQYPQLKEVVYFNDREIWAWPHGLGYPNWRVVRNQAGYPVRQAPQ
ncbi:glycosyl hydrolase family 5 [Mesorhizobium loti]|nr:glycosyl hydrolase family 5 [Mesorhizobium loti]